MDGDPTDEGPKAAGSAAPAADAGTVSLRFDTSTLARSASLRGALLQLPRFEPPEMAESARREAASVWLHRTRRAYVGVMVARRFHGLLVDLNAPMDLQELALELMLDEQRHARLCHRAATSLGGPKELEFTVDELTQERDEDDLPGELVATLTGPYIVGKRLELAILQHILQAAPPSTYRDALAQIARDRQWHASFGVPLLAQLRGGAPPRWLPWPGDDVVRARARVQLRAALSRPPRPTHAAGLFSQPDTAATLAAAAVFSPEEIERVRRQTTEVHARAALSEAGIPL